MIAVKEVKKRASEVLRASHTDGFGERREVEKNSETPGEKARSQCRWKERIRETFRSRVRIAVHRGKVG
jgi:hypothetical protein